MEKKFELNRTLLPKCALCFQFDGLPARASCDSKSERRIQVPAPLPAARPDRATPHISTPCILHRCICSHCGVVHLSLSRFDSFGQSWNSSMKALPIRV